MSLSVVTTQGNSPLSLLIRFATKEEATHFAIIFDNKLAFHSNLYGAHPLFRSALLKKAKVIDSLQIPTTLEKEEEIFQIIENKFDGKSYDYLGLIFWFFQAIPNMITGKPVHTIKKNLWNSDNQYMCTEIANALIPILPDLKEVDLSTFTPQGVMTLLRSYLIEKPYIEIK